MTRAEGGDDPVHRAEPGVGQRDPGREAPQAIAERAGAVADAGAPASVAACQVASAGPIETSPLLAIASVNGDAPVETYASEALGQRVNPVAGDDGRRAASQQVRVQDRDHGHEPLVAERLLVARPRRRGRPCGPLEIPSDATAKLPERTAFFVASEPVPAVVGTATNGVAGPE